jgi:hypothetical protein
MISLKMEFFDEWGKYLLDCSKVEFVYMDGIISPIRFANVLKHCPNISTLILNGEKINCELYELFSVVDCDVLKKIRILHSVATKDLSALAEFCTTITELDIYCLYPANQFHLMTFLKQNPKMKKLSMYGKDIDPVFLFEQVFRLFPHIRLICCEFFYDQRVWSRENINVNIMCFGAFSCDFDLTKTSFSHIYETNNQIKQLRFVKCVKNIDFSSHSELCTLLIERKISVFWDDVLLDIAV